MRLDQLLLLLALDLAAEFLTVHGAWYRVFAHQYLGDLQALVPALFLGGQDPEDADDAKRRRRLDDGTGLTRCQREGLAAVGRRDLLARQGLDDASLRGFAAL